MADLMTHFAVAYVLTRSSSFTRFRSIFYFGTILPDLISRTFYILKPELYPYTVAIHTPLFVFVFCLLSAEFFPHGIRHWIRKYLLLGAALHFCVDLFQRHLGSGYFWFFPFSWRSFEIGLYWPHEPLKFIPLWIILILSVELWIWIRRSRGKAFSAQGR